MIKDKGMVLYGAGCVTAKVQCVLCGQVGMSQDCCAEDWQFKSHWCQSSFAIYSQVLAIYSYISLTGCR